MNGFGFIAGFLLAFIWAFPASFGGWIAKVKTGYDTACSAARPKP